MCLVCTFCLIKKSWPVLNKNFVIPFLSLLYPRSFRLYPFLFSLSSELRGSQIANPRRPQLHCRQRRSTATLRGRRILSPPKSQPHAVLISIDAKEDPRLGFTVVVSHLHRQHSKIELLSPPTNHSKIQVWISLPPCFSMGFCVKIEYSLLDSDVSTCLCFLFLGFLPCFSSPIGKTHFSSSLFGDFWIVDLQSKYTCHTASNLI